ncbi:MAG: restriction endonuclease subunit S [Agitococcus sp.]|nr:restriction endonuclease subunit S [Agitococcus sp.]
MSFPCYSAYKDSGVEWLGEVPQGWDLKPIKTISTINDEVLPESTAGDFELNYVDIGSVSLDAGIEKTEAFCFKDAPSRARRLVKHGDIVVSTVRTYLKAIAAIKNPIENMIVSTGFAVIRPKPDVYISHFAKYSLQSLNFVDEVISRSTGISYPAINATDLIRIRIPVPSIAEQTTIAAFLDCETAKIDNLINKQKKLIELLKEKRQAVISTAVTKGLNPHAPMKESGVEWLGKVPEHWEVKPLKTVILKIIDNRGRTPPFGDEGIAMLEVKQITEGVKYPSDSFEKFVPESILKNFEREKVKENDILITTVGATSGKCVLVNKNPNYFIAQNVVGIRVISTVESTYLWYMMSSDFFYHSLIRINKSNTIDNLKVSIFINNLCTTPSLEEQTTIVAFLDQETAKIDNLIQQAQKATTLLQERRTALISAAVTGKIDVRNKSLPASL